MGRGTATVCTPSFRGSAEACRRAAGMAGGTGVTLVVAGSDSRTKAGGTGARGAAERTDCDAVAPDVVPIASCSGVGVADGARTGVLEAVYRNVPSGTSSRVVEPTFSKTEASSPSRGTDFLTDSVPPYPARSTWCCSHRSAVVCGGCCVTCCGIYGSTCYSTCSL